jgi:hypothetical protein
MYQYTVRYYTDKPGVYKLRTQYGYTLDEVEATLHDKEPWESANIYSITQVN